MMKHSTKMLLGIVFLYGLFLAYMAANVVFLGGGQYDLIYTHFGVPRREQFICATLFAGISAAVILMFILRKELLKPLINKNNLPALQIVLLLLFVNAITSSLSAVLSDIHTDFLLPLYLWVFIAFLILVASASLVIRYVRVGFVQIALLAIVASLAFYNLNLSLAPWYTSGALSQKILTLLFLFGASFTLFFALASNALRAKATCIILCLSALSPLASMIESVGKNDLSRFEDIALKDTPNIHIISVESLAAPVVIKKNLDLDTLAYEDTLKKNNILTYRNSFSSGFGTGLSLNTVMRLAQAGVSANVYDYFTGRTESPLGKILKQNGYHLSTGFPMPFFSYAKGKYVDSFLPDTKKSIKNNTLCLLANAPVASFFGFCSLVELFDDSKGGQDDDWVGQVISIIQSSEENTPAFTFHHILKPFVHTPGRFRTGNAEDTAEYREVFINQSKVAADLIQTLHDTFQTGDLGNSIVILMGDHGVLMSNTIEYSDDPEFYVQDNYGIVLGILYNGTGCSGDVLTQYMDKISTPERLLGGLIKCLSTNPQKVEETFAFTEPHDLKSYPYQ